MMDRETDTKKRILRIIKGGIFMNKNKTKKGKLLEKD